MAKYAQLPDGAYVEFPDDWSEAQMDEAVYRDFADQFPDKAPAEPGLFSRAADTAVSAADAVTNLLTEQGVAAGEWVRDTSQLIGEALEEPEAPIDAISMAGVPVRTKGEAEIAAEKLGIVPTAREALAAMPGTFLSGLAEVPGNIADFGLSIPDALADLMPDPNLDPNAPDRTVLGDLYTAMHLMSQQHREAAREGIVTPMLEGAESLKPDVPGLEFLPPGDIRRGAVSGAGSAGHMAGALLGGPKHALKVMFADVSGSEIRNLKDAWDDPKSGPLLQALKGAGYSDAGAAIIGSLYGGAELIGEKTALNQLFKKWGKNWLQELTKFVALETGQETITETLQAGLDKLTTDPDMTWGEFKDRYKDLYASMPFAIGGVTVPVKTAQSVAEFAEQQTKEQELDEWLQSIAEERARLSMKPDRGVAPEATVRRPDQVGPSAAPATAERVMQELQAKQEAAQAAEVLGGRTSGAMQLDEEEAMVEQMRILEQRMKAADEKRIAAETEEAYAQKEAQDQAAREKDLAEARVQVAEQEAETVEALERQDEEFAGRPTAMEQAYEKALDESISKEFRASYEKAGQQEEEGGIIVQRQDMAAEEEVLPADEEGNVELIHYSSQQGLTELDPDKYGTGKKGAEARRMKADPANWVNRSYAYVGRPETKEGGLGPHEYRIKVPAKDLYDLRSDPMGLKDQAREGDQVNLNLLERKVKEAGFKGSWVDAPQGRVAILFDKTPIAPTRAVETERPGGATAEFFTKMTLGEDGKPNVEYRPLLPEAQQKTEFIEEYNQHRGNFDNHIRASIPGFGETQILTGDAIINTYGEGARVLDIGASEGSWIKTITSNSGGKIKTTGIEPLKAMADFFEQKSQVPGAEFKMQAWGDEGWTEPDGTRISPFHPVGKYDLIHEAMTFQFIDNNRADQIARAKKALKPDGILLTEEKFKDDGTPEYKDREAKKDEYKSQYFTEKAIKDKAKETLVVGMNDNMVTKQELEQELMDQFDHVVEYWNSGNFGGYAASDDRIALEKFLKNLGDTSSEYSDITEPRWVSEEGLPAMLRKQAGPEPVGPDQPGEIPAFLKPQAARAPGEGVEGLTRYTAIDSRLQRLPIAVAPRTNEEFDSEIHIVTKESEELLKMIRANAQLSRTYRLPIEEEHVALRTLLTSLEDAGFPLRGATLGVRLFLVGNYEVVGRQSVVKKALGNRAFISLRNAVLTRAVEEPGVTLFYNSAAFTLTHEIGHSVDVREVNSRGERSRSFSQMSPLFSLMKTPEGQYEGVVINELYEAYLRDSLGLSALLQYPFGKTLSYEKAWDDGDLPRRTELGTHIKQEAFAQMFGLYYNYGHNAEGLAALREVMPNAINFMEQLDAILKTNSPTLDERDRSVRELFGRDTLQRPEDLEPRGPERDTTERPEGEEARARAGEIPEGRREAPGAERRDVTRDDVLANAEYNDEGGGADFMQYPEDQQPQAPSWTVPDETFKDRVARAFHDKFQRLYKTQEAIREAGGEAGIDVDAWAAEERFHGKVEADLRTMEEDHLEPLIAAMSEQGVSVEELDAYLMARHAPERNAVIAERREDMPDGGSGMTNAEAAETRGALEEKFPEIENLARRVWAMLDFKRQHMADFSLLSQDVIDQWEESYQYYVPLKGFAEDAINDDFPRIGAGFSIKGKEVKAATGRETKAFSPLVQSVQDTTESVIRARKNEVAQVFLELVEANPNPDFWKVFTEGQPDLEPTLQGGQVKMSPSAMANNPKYFGVKRDGVQYFIKLNDPLLAQAMQNLGVEKQGAYIRALSTVTRYLSSINTALDPEFVLSNFSRDIQTAVYNALSEQDLGVKIDTKRLARNMVKEVLPAMQPMHRALRRKDPRPGNEFDQYAVDFIEDGAKTGFFNTRDIEAQKRYVDHLLAMAQGGITGKALKVAKNVADMVADYNGTVENAVRLAAYKNARQIMERRGIPRNQARKRAAHLAKNLTVNFNRRGELSTALNAHFMFFNASVQGSAQFARTMLTPRKGPDGKRHMNYAQKVALAAIAFGYLAALINRARSDDDEDGVSVYDNIPSSVKERNFVIMKEDGRDYWAIPLPYGYNIFHVMGTTVSDMVHGPKEPLDAARETVMALLGSFNPVGMSVDDEPGLAAVKSVTPTILTPGVEIGFNSNFWGGKIWREDRYNERTPDAVLSINAKPHFQAMSRWLNEVTGGSFYERGGVDISPDSIEHLFEFATGGSGRFIGRTIGLAEKLSVGMPIKENDIPFWRKISKEPSAYVAGKKYYENLAIILSKEDAIKGLRGAERTEFRKENQEFMPLIRAANRTEGRLKAIRTRRDREMASAEGLAAQDAVKRKYQEKMDAEYNYLNRLWNDHLKEGR